MDKNIVLIGFMGCGKTTIGKLMSNLTGKNFIDMDDYIVEKEGISINEIFEKKGESYFRNLERELCVKLSEKDNKIIATGGGVIKSEENVENLKKGGTVFYLKSSSKKIASNLKNDHSRPLLAGGNKEEKIEKLLEERKELYKKCADVIIDVEKLAPKEAVREILDYMNKL